jgi:hypothetical protein
MPKPPGAWTPAVATKQINDCANQPNMNLSLTGHAKDQMAERDLIVGDLRHLLRRGFVFDQGAPATREGYFRYAIEGTTPNSDGRTVRAIVIPDGRLDLKIVTVMWRTER